MAFELSLSKQLPSSSNVICSLFSIFAALDLVHLEVRADTLKDMDHVLHFDKMGKDVHSAFVGYLEKESMFLQVEKTLEEYKKHVEAMLQPVAVNGINNLLKRLSERFRNEVITKLREQNFDMFL